MMAAFFIAFLVVAAIAIVCLLKCLDRTEPARFGEELARPNGGRRDTAFHVYHARHLSEEDWNGFFHVWNSIRARFENDPKAAIVYADLLISDLILDDSSPLPGETDELPDLDRLVAKYRAAHEIAMRGKAGILNAGEIRQAINLYTSLFDEVLGADGWHEGGQQLRN